jgi:tetraacyldisaccharide 4'-kinase
VDVESGRLYPPEAFEGERICAFCGIGNPQAFFRDLRQWGFSVVLQETFPDHHTYSAENLAALAATSKKHSLAAAVTTEKDAMNLPPLRKPHMPIVACVIRTELGDAENFDAALVARLDTSRVKV